MGQTSGPFKQHCKEGPAKPDYCSKTSNTSLIDDGYW